MKPLRIAVVGAGHLGKIHTKLWRDFAQTSPETVQLRALYDIHTERAAECAHEQDVQKTLGYAPHICLSLEEMLEIVDAVTIVSPTSTHFAIARQCLLAGKHCFIEKPMTTTSREAEMLMNTALERNLIIHVGHVERYNPAFQAMSGRLRTENQNPQFLEARRLAPFTPRATDVSVILDLMIHDLDLALWLINSPLVESELGVQASGAAVLTDSCDIAHARLQFQNGAVAVLAASRLAPSQTRSMLVFEETTCYSLDFAAPSLEIFHASNGQFPQMPDSTMLPATMLGDIHAPVRQTNNASTRTDSHRNAHKQLWYEKPTLVPSNAIAAEQQAFVRAVRERVSEHYSATAADALAALRVAERITEQIARAK